MSYLPSATTMRAPSRILSFDVGPGTGLLDLLTEKLTGGEHRYDPGGRLAVQGRRVDELIDHWLADPYYDRPLPRWHPQGVRPQRFLADAMQMAVSGGWSVRDILCSATHLIAESVAVALDRRLPGDAKVGEMLVTGGGCRNGMLLGEINQRCPMPLRPLGELGLPDEALAPACAAMLALFHIDQIPANGTAASKADVPRLLGRLTPGSPQDWQRLLQSCSGRHLVTRPLRSAL